MPGVGAQSVAKNHQWHASARVEQRHGRKDVLAIAIKIIFFYGTRAVSLHFDMRCLCGLWRLRSRIRRVLYPFVLVVPHAASSIATPIPNNPFSFISNFHFWSGLCPFKVVYQLSLGTSTFCTKDSNNSAAAYFHGWLDGGSVSFAASFVQIVSMPALMPPWISAVNESPIITALSLVVVWSRTSYSFKERLHSALCADFFRDKHFLVFLGGESSTVPF